MFRKSLIAVCAAALFAGSVTPASAGLFSFCKKDCCDPCAAPEPVCCEAPAPVCAPEPVCCEAPAPVCAPAPVVCAPPAPVCAPEPVCCPPAPADVAKTVCLCDPCGCMKAVDLCIPACCANEEPCITCRKGLFGRKIYTLSWKCCGHCVKVVMTKRGTVRVR